MKKESLRREIITTTLIESLKPLDYVYALWEAGAAGFGRIDEWSDIDLYIACDDEQVEETIGATKKALLTLSEIDLWYRLPEPTWHGHSQVFCTLKEASPFLFLDTVFMKRSSEDKFLQYKIHGEPTIHFDKADIVKNNPVNRETFLQKIESRLEELKVTFELFQVLTLKELYRENDIEALLFYLNFTYKPLVEVLRIKYCPLHYNFYYRYIHYDLPAEVVTRLQRLAFTATPEAVRANRAEAEEWFWEVADSITHEELEKGLNVDVT